MAEESSGGGIEVFWAIVIVLVLFTMWVQGGGPSRAKDEGLFRAENDSSSIVSSQTSNSTSNSNQPSSESLESEYKGKIRLQRGTASATYQPNQEYVVITVSGNKEPIDIGGWVLSNGINGVSHHLFLFIFLI